MTATRHAAQQRRIQHLQQGTLHFNSTRLLQFTHSRVDLRSLVSATR